LPAAFISSNTNRAMTIFRITDIETTGTDANEHAIVEIACVDLDDRCFVAPRSSLVKPPHHVPPQTSAIHHLTDADLVNAPSARDIVPVILTPGDKPIYVAHNAGFEQSFLAPYVPDAVWLCTFKAALRRFPELPGHSNQCLRYCLDLDRKYPEQAKHFMPPHRALPDAWVTACILDELLIDVPIDDMVAWTSEPALLPTCPIGTPWRGMPWARVDDSFLCWIIKKEGMDGDLVWNASRELKRRIVERQDRIARDQKELELIHRREAYLTLAKPAVELAQSVDDLRTWFGSESERRTEYGVIPGTAEHAAIVAACQARKEKILQSVTQEAVS
jgi:exodeoxyribonuclease X